MTLFINWWKKYWYLCFLVTLGFSFYLYMIFIRFLRHIEDGPIVHENLPEFRIYINYFITFIFFCFFIIFIRIIYRLYTNTTTTSSFSIKIQEQVIKINKFYEDVLNATVIFIMFNTPHFSTIIPTIFPYYNRFLASTMIKDCAITCTIMFILISGMPFIVSISFFIDAYNNQYYYFPRTAILLVIPLIINSIWYTFKTISERIIVIFNRLFIINVEDYDTVTHIQVRHDHKLYQSFLNLTPEDVKDRLEKDFNLLKVVYKIKFCDRLWQIFLEYFRLYILLFKFFIIVFFFFAWLLITYRCIYLIR